MSTEINSAGMQAI